MKRKHFSVEQIVAIVKQAEVVPVAWIRQVGISEQRLVEEAAPGTWSRTSFAS